MCEGVRILIRCHFYLYALSFSPCEFIHLTSTITRSPEVVAVSQIGGVMGRTARLLKYWCLFVDSILITYCRRKLMFKKVNISRLFRPGRPILASSGFMWSLKALGHGIGSWRFIKVFIKNKYTQKLSEKLRLWYNVNLCNSTKLSNNGSGNLKPRGKGWPKGPEPRTCEV